MAVAAGVAAAAVAVVGAPHGPVPAGGSMAATVILTGRRPCAVVPRVGIAAVSALPTTLSVVAGASGVAARLGQPSDTELVARNAGMVFTPGVGPAAVVGRPGTVIKGSRPAAPVGSARRGGRG